LLLRYIRPGAGGLRGQGDDLVELPDYAQRRDSIAAALRAMGQHAQADSLPRPRVMPAADFLKTLRGRRAQVGAAIERMREDPTLLPRDAALRVGMPPEAFSLAIDRGPGRHTPGWIPRPDGMRPSRRRGCCSTRLAT
jgi:hypothetical protein